MNVLVINCSPVRNGATAEIVKTVSQLYGHLEIDCCGSIGFCSIESKNDVSKITADLEKFCMNI